LLALALEPTEAFARAGGGSFGFSGGDEGGGGSSFGGGGGGAGHALFLFLIFRALLDLALLGPGLGALFLIALAAGWYFFTRVWPRLQANAEARRREGRARS